MLTDTVGWRRHQLRQKRSAGSLQDKPCLKAKFKGYCGFWRRECRIREEILTELKEKNEKELLEKQRREEEGIVLSPEEVAAEKKKKDDEPTLEHLLQLRLRKRCPFKHPQQGRIKNKGASAEEKLTNLLTSYLSAERLQVPWTLLEDSDSDSDIEDDDEKEGGNDNALKTATDEQQEEPLRWFTVRSNGLSMVNLSYLRPMVTYFNEQQSATGGMVTDLVPQEIDLDSAPFRKCLFIALKRIKDLVTPSSPQPLDGDEAATAPGEEDDAENRQLLAGASIRSLLLHHNDLKSGEEFLTHLKSSGLHGSLQSLDMSSNKLESMRMLFNLRAAFPELLNLSLINNPITRKPNYREQVRKTLETLIRLDGELIRQPPLDLPHPTLPQHEDPETRKEALNFLLDYLGHIELQSEGLVDKGLTTLDEEFAMRFLHPSVTFSLVVQPGTVLYDEQKYVHDERYKLLSGQDRRELETFQISIQNANRDLRLGKIAIHRMSSGPLDVMNSYLSTIYPERFSVQHNLGHCLVSTAPLIRKTDMKAAVAAAVKKEEAKNATGGGAAVPAIPHLMAMTDPKLKKTKAQKLKEREIREKEKAAAKKVKKAEKLAVKKAEKAAIAAAGGPAAVAAAAAAAKEAAADSDSASSSSSDDGDHEPKSAEAIAMIERMKKLGITPKTRKSSSATTTAQAPTVRGKRDRDEEAAAEAAEKKKIAEEEEAAAQAAAATAAAATASAEGKSAGKLFAAHESDRKPIVVTMHGTMLWRTPSMRSTDGVRVCFDRVFTLQYHKPDQLGMLHKNEKFRNYQARQYASKNPVRLFIRNDSLTLRPFCPAGPVYSPFSAKRAERLSVVFGLEGMLAETSDTDATTGVTTGRRQPKSGPGMVRAMMERTNSDKALYELLAEVTCTTGQKKKKHAEQVLPGGGLEQRAKSEVVEGESDDMPVTTTTTLDTDAPPMERCATVLMERSVSAQEGGEQREEDANLSVIQRSNSVTFSINRH